MLREYKKLMMVQGAPAHALAWWGLTTSGILRFAAVASSSFMRRTV